MRKYFPLCLVLFLFVGCKKSEVEGVCKKRYIESVQILEIENHDGLDLIGGPDLRIYVKPSSALDWMYVSNTAEDVDQYPVTISFAHKFLSTEEEWMFKIVDDDPLGEEYVTEGYFSPYENWINNRIIPHLIDGTNRIEIIYTEVE